MFIPQNSDKAFFSNGNSYVMSTSDYFAPKPKSQRNEVNYLALFK